MAGPPKKSSAASSHASTQRIARDLKSDRERAFGDLYVRVSPAIYTYASLRLGERWVGPEDVVAEVWSRVHEHLGDYDETRSFRGWVFGFAQRVVMEAQRRLLRGRSVPAQRHDGDSSSGLSQIPDSITSVCSRVAHDEEIRRFVAWVRSELSEYEREVLLLRGIQGRALGDVAVALGRTERAVTVCWARILEKVARRRPPRGLVEPEA